MLQLEDKITIALAGPIKAGKDILLKHASTYQDLLYQSLAGNFWIPQKLTIINDQPNLELFERYSQNPKQYAFEFQVACMANRLAQQNHVDASTGLILLGQPLEIDRHIYAQANRAHLSDSFSSYDQLYAQVKKRVTPPDIWIYVRITEQQLPLLLDRIERYGRPGEKKFLQDPSYLLENIRLHEQFFAHNRQPIITLDGTLPLFDQQPHQQNATTLIQTIATQINQYCPPHHLTLDEWEAIDYNKAQNGMRQAKRQLRQYVQQHQKIITIAGPVGAGKTGLAELISHELEIDIFRELDGKNDQIVDELLFKFLADKKTYAYDLQKSLLPKRVNARKELAAQHKSFIEDRSPVEDQSIFWRRLHQQGYLSDQQLAELKTLAIQAYQSAPKSDVLIQLFRDAKECRKMILNRGRLPEVKAWPQAELEAMQKLYDDFVQDIQQYGSHHGPTLSINLHHFNPKNTIHQGYLWQEILHGLLDNEKE